MKPQIPWLRVFVEGVVIVGSILLSFGIQAWWDERQEAEETVEMLRGLHADFESHRAVFQRHLGIYVEIQADLRVLLDPEEAKNLTIERLDSAFLRIVRSPTLDLGQGTRDAVILSGRLELIDQEELRQRLAGWGRWVDEVRDMQLVMRQYSWDHIASYLAARGVPMSRAMTTRYALEWPVPLPSPQAARRAYESVLRDSTFQSHLALRYGTSFWHVADYQAAGRELDEILRLIEVELEPRR